MIKQQTFQLINDLKTTCQTYDMGNYGNEYKIITLVFLYKSGYELKKANSSYAAKIRNATDQALQILQEMNASRESFRKIGLTFEEKAFYDILMALRDQYNFEYGEDKIVDGIFINEKCKTLAIKVKELIDTKSSFADWLNNQNIRDQLKFDIKVCLIKNGYPPQYSPEVFSKVMEQVENFEENGANS